MENLSCFLNTTWHSTFFSTLGWHFSYLDAYFKFPLGIFSGVAPGYVAGQTPESPIDDAFAEMRTSDVIPIAIVVRTNAETMADVVILRIRYVPRMIREKVVTCTSHTPQHVKHTLITYCCSTPLNSEIPLSPPSQFLAGIQKKL